MPRAPSPTPARQRRAATREPAAPRPTADAGVRSLARAVALLNALAESAEGMTAADAAQLAGLPLSTAHRLLIALEELRFARHEPALGLWQVGVGAFVVGNAFARTRDAVTLARPRLRRLAEAAGETASLYLAEDGRAVCMAQAEARRVVRAAARPGGRTAMHASGAGKAMLAWGDEAELAAVLRERGMPRLTPRTLDTPAKLRADLARTRERGYAVDDEEVSSGVRCAAAPVLDEDGAPVAAVSVSGPAERVTPERLATLGALVAALAAELSELYGGSLRER